MKSILAVLILVLLPSIADAQWIRRGRVIQSQSYSVCPGGVCPTSPGRWKNYDGLSFRDHAEIKHGINTVGLSDAQVGILRDRDHDRYGESHPAFLKSLPDRNPRVIKRVPAIIKPIPPRVPIESRSFLPIEAYYRGR